MKTAQLLLLLSIIIYSLILSTAFGQGLNWQQTGGPTGGTINSIGISSNGTLIAVSAGGVYRSSDNGNYWQRNNYVLQNTTTEIITVNNFTIFGNDGNIFRSTDNGETWSIAGAISGLVKHLCSNDSGVLFLTSEEKVFVSTNYGESWSTNTDPKPFSSIYGITASGNDIYIAANNGIYHSTNNGNSWINISGDLPPGICYSIMVKSGKVFTGKNKSIYFSADNGITWTQGTADFTGQAVSFASDSAGNLYSAAGDVLLKSSDNGSNWQRLKEFVFPSGVPGVIVFKNDGTAFAASHNSILRFTNNFETVDELSAGMINTVIYDVATSPEGKVFAIGDFDVFSTSDKGATWQPTKANSVFGVYPNHRIAIDRNSNIFIGYGSGYGLSTDNGETWKKYLVGSNSELKSFAFGNNGITYALGNTDVYRTTNNGFTWHSVVTFSNETSDSRIITDRFGYVYYPRYDGIYRSVNDGVTWSRLTPAEVTGVTDFIITRKGRIIVGTSTGMYLSSNLGSTWKSVPVGNYGQSHIYTLYEAPGGQLLVTTTYGLFVSVNDGENWTYVDDSATRGFAASYFTTDKEGYLYASSPGKGVFRTLVPFIKISAPVPVVLPGAAKAYIKWSKNSSADFKEYRIYGSSEHYPLAVVYTTTGGAEDTSTVLAGLSNGQPYYVVVSAVDIYGNETFSDEYTVIPVTVPSAPELLSIEDNSSNITVNPLLKWRKSINAEFYHFQLSADSSFTVSLDDTLLTDTTRQLNNLLPLTEYYWRVKSIGAVEEGEWSRIWSFTTGVLPPGNTILHLPGNNAADLPIQDTLIWRPSEGATGYHLQLSGDSLFTFYVINDSALTDTLAGVLLENNKVYFWRVKGINSSGPGEWSEIWKFKTIVSVPEAPVLLLPADKSTEQPKKITLIWNSVSQAETYLLQVYNDLPLTSVFFEDTAVSGLSKELVSLKSGKKYFWRITAKNSAGSGKNSPVWSFTTILEPPVLTAETAGIETNKLLLTDNSDASPAFIVERKSAGGYSVIDTAAAGSSEYYDSTAQSGIKYTYRVKAITGDAQSAYSNEVVVNTITGVENNPAVPAEYALKQNYPNPFNPITTIKFALPEPAFARLVVYNSLGEVVKTLVNENRPAGFYEIIFDAKSLPSGMYIYRLEAGKFIQSVKMILLK